MKPRKLKNIQPHKDMATVLMDCIVNILSEGKEHVASTVDKPPLLVISDEDREGDNLAEVLYERLELADEVIKYLVRFLLKQPDLLPIPHLEKTLAEVNQFYETVKKQLTPKEGFLSDSQLKAILDEEYDRLKDSFQYLKREHLDGDTCVLVEGHERRTFRVKAMNKIVDSYDVFAGVKDLRGVIKIIES